MDKRENGGWTSKLIQMHLYNEPFGGSEKGIWHNPLDWIAGVFSYVFLEGDRDYKKMSISKLILVRMTYRRLLGLLGESLKGGRMDLK